MADSIGIGLVVPQGDWKDKPIFEDDENGNKRQVIFGKDLLRVGYKEETLKAYPTLYAVLFPEKRPAEKRTPPTPPTPPNS